MTRQDFARSVIRNLDAAVVQNEFSTVNNKAARVWAEMRHRWQEQDEERKASNMADRDTKGTTPPPTK